MIKILMGENKLLKDIYIYNLMPFVYKFSMCKIIL